MTFSRIGQLIATRPQIAYAWSIIAGSFYPLAFAPYNYYFLIFASLAILFLCFMVSDRKQVFIQGYLFGFSLFASGIYWLHESFAYSQVELPLAIFLTTAFIAFFALYPALLLYFLKRLFPVPSLLLLLLALPAAWTLLEWFRGWFLTGFPWLQAGYSQTDTLLIEYAPYSGILGITWLVALTAASISALFLMGSSKPRHLISMIALIWGMAIPLSDIQWTEKSGRVKTVSLIQGNIPQDLKWLPSERQATLDTYLSLSQQNPADLIIWPETAIPAFMDSVPRFIGEVTAFALANNSTVLSGIPVSDNNFQTYYNSMIMLGKDTGVYHKRHLVPFGEYLPFRSLLAGITDFLKIPMSRFAPGDIHQPLLKAAGETLAVSICYEGVFGEEIRRDLPAASLLVNISNDAWFGESIAAEQHLQMIRVRAKENGRFLLRSTNTGISAIINPDAKIVARSPRLETHVLKGTFHAMSGSTPYIRFGNLPVVLLMFTFLGLTLILSKNKHENKQ